MAFDTFMKIDGVPGESTDDKHKGWIELLGFDHEMVQPTSATASSAGGATDERVNIRDFRVVKMLDMASPKLYEYCCKGTHIPSITIEMCRAGGDKIKYMEIKMEEVVISAVHPSGMTKQTDSFPTEAVGLNFGKITWTYTQQKRADGSGGGNVTALWNLKKNAAVA